MNRFGLLIGVLSTVLFAVNGPAQTHARDPDHEALRKLMKKATAAINAKDAECVAECLTKDFAFTTIDQSVITNRAGIQAYFDRMLKGPDAPLAAMSCAPEADVLTRFAGDSAGYCYGRSIDTYTLKDQRVFKLNVRWSAMVVKEDGQWKASLIHTGVDFLDNPVLTAQSALLRRTVAVILGVAAILAVAGYLIGARRAALNRAK